MNKQSRIFLIFTACATLLGCGTDPDAQRQIQVVQDSTRYADSMKVIQIIDSLAHLQDSLVDEIRLEQEADALPNVRR
ncbi:hypothetical protein [Pontibacter sp. G13]|uniref:hypothetical protein n=1 Tax=Pontibacter sp. G13 TaxID=3074898 RepID=UPI002889D986|nr:hypothetical protein [Pontibacter sp. G13]WNJ16747.1 hypothetical protein RJD25_17915 [Pontibacter sp. G13]